MTATKLQFGFLVTTIVFVSTSYVASLEFDHDVYTNEFVVEVTGDSTVADLVGGSHGLRLVRAISGLDNTYWYVHESVSRRSRRAAEDLVTRLNGDPNVRSVEQQRVLKREKRRIVHDKQIELPIRHIEDKSIYKRVHVIGSGISTKDEIPGSGGVDDTFMFNDPYFKDQWYLLNKGQTGGKVGYDINVVPVWKKGITGQGVVVSILDDGVDHNHPDLQRNFDADASADLNDKNDVHNDPVPNSKDPGNSHGTRCAGEVAAQANNSDCCVGVAFNAKIGGIRMLDGPVTDRLEAEALLYNYNHIDIYSASWGPTDDGKTMEGPHKYCQKALEQGVTKGRGGKGSIFVWATGNGGSVGDDCSCDGYVSSIYTLSVGCISDQGLSTYFSEICPSTMAVVFTGGSHKRPGDADYKAPKIKVVTTDLHGECTLEFQGTSSAAPLAAGCIALVLEANRNLTWRDVQNIVVETARIPNSEEDGWTVNGGGYHVNHRFGFGAMDCARMVEAAQNWITVQEQHNCTILHRGSERDINADEVVTSRLSVDGCRGDGLKKIDHLEHVQVHVKLEHKRRGDLSIILTSPAGTKSRLLSPRPLDDSKEGVDFTFMTVHNWGEDPRGTWTLEVADNDENRDSSESRANRGRLISWGMRIFGVAGDRPNHKTSESGRSSQMSHKSSTSREVGSDEIKRLMTAEAHSKDSVQIQAKNQLSARSTETFMNGLNREDVEFLRNLFETEEELKKRNLDENTDGTYSEGYPARKSRQWTKDEVVNRLHEGRALHEEGRTNHDADESQLIDSIVNSMDPDTLDKIVRDLSEYINRDDA